MQKIRLLLAFCLLATLTFSQGKVENGNIVIGKTDSIQSKILGENRKIWVHVPDGGTNQKYPIVYDKAHAIVQFKKALAIKENEGSRKKLTALESGKK